MTKKQLLKLTAGIEFHLLWRGEKTTLPLVTIPNQKGEDIIVDMRRSYVALIKLKEEEVFAIGKDVACDYRPKFSSTYSSMENTVSQKLLLDYVETCYMACCPVEPIQMYVVREGNAFIIYGIGNLRVEQPTSPWPRPSLLQKVAALLN